MSDHANFVHREHQEEDANPVHLPGVTPAETSDHETLNVKALRAKIGVSQASFARNYKISLRTLQDWEQGRRKPQGPARVLLMLIEADPNWVREALKKKPLRPE